MDDEPKPSNIWQCKRRGTRPQLTVVEQAEAITYQVALTAQTEREDQPDD